MTLELYHASESLCSQKVKLVLAEKGLKWKSHLINLLTFENLQPSYMRLNPKGVVPTLVHQGRVITDSAAIIRYLDEKFPHPPLIPANPMWQEKMDRWIDLQNRFPMREVIYGNYQGIEGVALRRSIQMKERLLPKLAQANPELQKQYAAKLEDVRQWNCTAHSAAEIATLNSTIVPMLDQLETQLNQTTWLCGDSYSLADTIWTAVLHQLDELRFSDLWADHTRPALGSYLNRLKSRPSFNTAVQSDKMPLPMLLAGLRRVSLNI